MAPSTLRKAIGAVKDTTSIARIGLTKVSSAASLSDIDVAIVKATRHEEYPADERHIREILGVTSYSLTHVSACVAAISHRLNKTKNWVVALKTLILVQRLLNEGDPAFEQEVFFTTRRGTRLLNMSDFRDTKRKDSWAYSAFVRTYALYLDEQLEYRMQNRRGRRSTYSEHEEEGGPAPMRSMPVCDMRNEPLFSRVHHLMQLLERFLACRPTGSAKQNRVVLIALYPIVKESFQIYYDITEILSTLIDRFVALEIADSEKVYEIFGRVSKQFDELREFYSLCKNIAIARSSEYPEIDKITQKRLDVMDACIKDKSTPPRNKKVLHLEQKHEAEDEDNSKVAVEEDINAIKALPPPEGFADEPEKEEKKEEVKAESEDKCNTAEKEADLLNLAEDMLTSEEHGDKLALALFDDGSRTGSKMTTTTTAWEAFQDTNWETTLVESTTHLSDQKPLFPGGFDTMLLDGMYQQGAINQAMASSGYATTGSASSIAFGSAGRPAMLALPAPSAAGRDSAEATGCADPFSASLPVPPPSYVQMSEMEKKQRLLMEEQLMWQQYARDGMPGQVGLTKVQPKPYPYNMGGYTSTY